MDSYQSWEEINIRLNQQYCKVNCLLKNQALTQNIMTSMIYQGLNDKSEYMSYLKDKLKDDTSALIIEKKILTTLIAQERALFIYRHYNM